MKKDQYLLGLSEGSREYWDVQLDVGRYKNIIHLYLIEVPEKHRGKGYAKLLIKRLCNYADKQKCIITLKPTAQFGADLERLVNFYKNFGFVFNADDNYREDIAEVMYRCNATESEQYYV